jgi:DNA-binding winged helix-turn-helix (wHTH) protein
VSDGIGYLVAIAMGAEATASIAQRTPIQRESILLDFPARELRRGNTRISLTGQPLEILRVLLERPGEVVDRDELVLLLWPNGTFVDFEHSLNAAIKRLRAALGDNAQNPRFLETVPRRGYRWIHASMLRSVRVAVLPFSSDDLDDSFVRGLKDELFIELGRCAHLELTWGQSSHSAARPDYFLEGSVRRYGARVRVGAWLIDARRQAQAWSDIYERHDSESPAVIDIAALISAAVVARLAPVTEIQSVTRRLSRADRELSIRSGRISAVAR